MISDTNIHEEVETALSYISPDMDHKEWFRILASVKDALGDSGFELVAKWSAQSEKFDSKSIKSSWRYIKPNVIRKETLFRLAYDNGMPKPQPNRAPVQARPIVPRQPIGDLKPESSITEEELLKARATLKFQWDSLRPLFPHPHLLRKGILDKIEKIPDFKNQLRSGFSKQHQAYFYAHPIVDVITGEFKGFQRIFETEKKVAFGTEKQGNATIIGNLTYTSYFALMTEGFSDGVHVHFATGGNTELGGIPTIVAIDAGNMPAAAQRLSCHLKNLHLVICADNDSAGIQYAMRGFIAFDACHFEKRRPPRAVVVFPPQGKDFTDSVLAGEIIAKTIWQGMKLL